MLIFRKYAARVNR